MEKPAPRQDFPVLTQEVDGIPIVYLDSAATSLKPGSVVDAIMTYYTTIGANIHRGKHILSERASDDYESVRAACARFLGCKAHEIVFTSGTTAAVNAVAAGAGLDSDDLVLCQLDSHHSNLLPWMQRARIELIEVDRNGEVDLDHYAKLLRRAPKIVALNHCSNVTGVYAPIAAMAAMARSTGSMVFVDAAQSAPHRRIVASALEADFVAFSAHKMLGPTGLGVLFVRDARIADLTPSSLGGGTVDWVERASYTLRRPPYRFEGGTPNISAVYGFGAALRYLETVGYEAVEAHDRFMADCLGSEVRSREYVSAIGLDAQDRAGIVGLRLRGAIEYDEVARVLSDSYGVMSRSGHMCAQPFVDAVAGGPVLRFSTYLYTDAEDVRRAFSSLDETCAALGIAVASAVGG